MEKLYRCPFTNHNVIVGMDCECGAKAINKDLWIDKDKPLMRSKYSTLEDVIFNKLNNGEPIGLRWWHIREMIEENDLPILQNHPLIPIN